MFVFNLSHLALANMHPRKKLPHQRVTVDFGNCIYKLFKGQMVFVFNLYSLRILQFEYTVWVLVGELIISFF